MLYKHNFCKRKNIVLAVASAIALSVSPAWADKDRIVDVHLDAQSADSSLMELAKTAKVHIMISADIGKNIRLPELSGKYTLSQALDTLLNDTGLSYEFLSDNSVVITEDKDEKSESEVKKSDDVEEIVVTGSRIAKAASQLAANVITLSAEDLRGTGESTLEGALRQLPQNVFGASEVGAAVVGSGMSFNGAINITGASSINLRGLGAESTLVLIDGRRIGKSGVFGGISDISGIPLTSIDRVEIMLDGASSIYGSDAVGGVVNIITKKDYQGGEITYQYNTPDKGGFAEHILTVSGGTSWDSGRVRATFEHYQRSNLDGDERPQAIRSDLYNSPGVFQDEIYRYNGELYNEFEIIGLLGNTQLNAGLANGSIEKGFAQIPFDLSENDLTREDLIFLPSQSDGADLYYYDDDASGGISLLPKQRRDTIQFGVDQEVSILGYDIDLHANVYYSDRYTEAADGAFILSASVPKEDYPFATSGILGGNINWRFPGYADKHHETSEKIKRWSISADGNIGESWRWSASAGQSHSEIDSHYYNESILGLYLPPALYALNEILGLFDPTYTDLYNEGLRVLSSDMLTENSPELIQQLIIPESTTLALNEENTFEVRADGAIFDLPGGSVHMAVGSDWRQEILESESTRNILQSPLDRQEIGATIGLQGGYDPSKQRRVQRGYFVELLVPVVGEANNFTGMKSLNLTGSARYDSYQKQGGASTWSLGVVWEPADEWRVRLNQSTSYVVPTFRDQIQPPEIDDNSILYAPNPGQPLYYVDEEGNLTGDVEYLAATISGGNPDLKPETADTVSAGFEYSPSVIPGLTFNVSWSQTEYKNRVGTPRGIEELGLISGVGRTLLSGVDYVEKYRHISRDANGNLISESRSINIAEIDRSGVDYGIRYNRETDIGHFLFNMNIAYTDKYEYVNIPGDEPINQVANVGFGSRTVIPAYRYSANLGWYARGLSVNLNATTASKTVSTLSASSVQRIQRTAKPAIDADLVVAYDIGEGDLFSSPTWLGDASVSFKILNLLNDDAEYDVIDLNTGEKPVTHSELNANVSSPRGRMFNISVTKRF